MINNNGLLQNAFDAMNDPDIFASPDPVESPQARATSVDDDIDDGVQLYGEDADRNQQVMEAEHVDREEFQQDLEQSGRDVQSEDYGRTEQKTDNEPSSEIEASQQNEFSNDSTGDNNTQQEFMKDESIIDASTRDLEIDKDDDKSNRDDNEGLLKDFLDKVQDGDQDGIHFSLDDLKEAWSDRLDNLKDAIDRGDGLDIFKNVIDMLESNPISDMMGKGHTEIGEGGLQNIAETLSAKFDHLVNALEDGNVPDMFSSLTDLLNTDLVNCFIGIEHQSNDVEKADMGNVDKDTHFRDIQQNEANDFDMTADQQRMMDNELNNASSGVDNGRTQQALDDQMQADSVDVSGAEMSPVDIGEMDGGAEAFESEEAAEAAALFI